MTAQVSYGKAIYAGFSDLSVFSKQLLAVEGLHRYIFGATQTGDEILKTLKSFKDVADFYSIIPEAKKFIEFASGNRTDFKDSSVKSIKFFVCVLKVTEVVKKTFKLAVFNQAAFGMTIAKGVGEISVQTYNIYKAYVKIHEFKGVLENTESAVSFLDSDYLSKEKTIKEKWAEIAMSVSIIGLSITDMTVKTVAKFTGAETIFVVGGLAISAAGFCKSYYNSLASQHQDSINSPKKD